MRTDEPVEFSPALCFVLGLSIAIPIAPEARLTLFDAVATFLVLHRWRMVQTLFSRTFLLLTVSLIAMAASAYLNGSDLRPLVGRAYQPIALLVEAIAYCILILGTDDKGRSSLILGVMLGICSHYFYPNDLRILEEPIKFLVGIPLGAGLLALYSLAVPRGSASIPLVISLMLGYSLFCFIAGSRSIGGVYFASAIAVAILGFIKPPKNYSKFAPLTILAACLVGYSLTELYTFLAVGGFFGDRAAGIAAFQSSFGSILLGGRPEILINLVGIKDSPLFGVGILNYPSIYLYEMINLSVYAREDVLDFENVLYHSVVFATAFESGLIAASFWIYLLYRSAFVIPLLGRMTVGARAFSLPLIIVAIWHLLYSPPIPYNRFVMAIGIALVFYLHIDWKRAKVTQEEVTDIKALPLQN